MIEQEIDDNAKHRAFHRDKLSPDMDLFTPEFKRDSRGRYFMQLPGYGKWMVSVEPGSKVISQGSETESGKAATNPNSIQTGSLDVDTTIKVGDNVYINGSTGCIYVGDWEKQVGTSISMCGDGLYGWSGKNVVFGFALEKNGILNPGDFIVGSYNDDEYLRWDNANNQLVLHGAFVIQGDITSANFVHGSSGYKLTYLTGNAEFQNVWVRGQVNMEAGSTGDASYIAETISRKWAAETGADITGSHTSNNTNNVSFSTALDAATGAQRGLNAINAFYRYGTWLNSDEMTTMGGEPADTNTCVRMDSGGIYGWRTLAATPVGESRRTFWLDANTGDLMLRGTIYASAGAIAGWIIDADRLYKTKADSGHYNKIELNSRSGPGIAPHFQVFSDTDAGFGSPTGVQLTCDTGATPVPRMDVYDNGAKRAMINKDGMHLFDTSNNRRVLLNYNGIYWYSAAGAIQNQILASSSDGDVTFGGGVVRLFSNGIRTSFPQGLNASDGLGFYFQMYVKSGETYGSTATLSTGSNNFLRIENNSNQAIAHFAKTVADSWALNLYGNLGLHTRAADGTGTYEGTIYYNTGSKKIKLRTDTAWVDVGGSSLPAGGNYQMLRYNTGSAQWVATSNVYVGSRSDYTIYRDAGTADMYFNVPAGEDYAFYVGGSPKFTINANIWTSGVIWLGTPAVLSISWNGAQCYVNKTIYTYGDLECRLNLIVGGTIIRFNGTYFYKRTLGSVTPGKYIIAEL